MKNEKLTKAYLDTIQDDSSYEKESNCYYTSEEWNDLAKTLNEDELAKKLKDEFETLVEDCGGAIDAYEMYGYGESSIYSDVIGLLSLVVDEIDYKYIANELKKEVA